MINDEDYEDDDTVWFCGQDEMKRDEYLSTVTKRL